MIHILRAISLGLLMSSLSYLAIILLLNSPVYLRYAIHDLPLDTIGDELEMGDFRNAVCSYTETMQLLYFSIPSMKMLLSSIGCNILMFAGLGFIIWPLFLYVLLIRYGIYLIYAGTGCVAIAMFGVGCAYSLERNQTEDKKTR